MSLSAEDKKKQELYRDARFNDTYDGIWQSTGKCVFCDLKPKYVLHEENNMALTITVFAYIDGHMMIIPKRHVRSVKELTATEWETTRKMMYLAKKLARKTHGIKGMQYVQKDGSDAQSTVEHLHFHCIPFDGPDLSTWHYRKLKNTPLENVQAYRGEEKSLNRMATKYDEKYGSR